MFNNEDMFNQINDRILKQINSKLINFKIKKPIIDKQKELINLYRLIDFSFDSFLHRIASSNNIIQIMDELEEIVKETVSHIEHDGRFWKLFEVYTCDELEKKIYQYIAVTCPKYIYQIHYEEAKEQTIDSILYQTNVFPGMEN